MMEAACPAATLTPEPNSRSNPVPVPATHLGRVGLIRPPTLASARSGQLTKTRQHRAHLTRVRGPMPGTIAHAVHACHLPVTFNV